MNRMQQRDLGALALGAKRAALAHERTYKATCAYSADLLEHHANANGELFRDYTAEQRRRMAKDGRALPDGSFPIVDCADAADAIHSIGRAKDRSAAEAHIRKRVRSLGCTGSLYDNWK